MSFTFRVWFCFLALSPNVISPALAQSQSVSSALVTKQPADEAALRALAEAFFHVWAAKDLDGFLRLWSAKSTELEARRKGAQELFAVSEKIELRNLAIRAVKAEGANALVRVEVDVRVIEAKTGKEKAGYGKMLRTLECEKETGHWKVRSEVSTYAEIAEALAATKSDEECAALLAGEKDLVKAELVEALNRQGGRFVNQGNYPQALASFNMALSVGGRIGDQSGIIDALMGSGFTYWLQGNYAKALERFHKCLAMLETKDNKGGIARALNNIGNVYRSQGDYTDALEYYRKSLAINEVLGDESEIATNLGNIGVVYVKQGNLAGAMDYYQKSLALSKSKDDKLGIAITLGNIGALHRKQGNYAQALDHYQQSYALSVAINDQVGIAQMLNNIGIVHRFQANYAQALEYHQKSLALNQSLGDQGGKAGALAQIGSVHNAQGNYELSAEYYQKSRSIQEAIGDKDGVARTLVQLAVNCKQQGRYTQSLGYAEHAATLARQMGSLEILSAARVTAGLAHRGLNQPNAARQTLEEAIAVIEMMRANVAGGEQEQQSFFASKVSPYHAMVDLLTRDGRAPEALTFAERAKARVLLDVLQTGRINVNKALTPQERERESLLRSELVSLNTQVTRAGRKDKADQARLDELKSLREKARLDYEAFQTSLYTAHPELRAQRGEAPVIKADEIAALLPDTGSALLEYVVTDEVAYLFVSDKAAGAQVYTLPIKRDELTKQTESFRRQLAGRDLGFRASARRLYQLLLEPAQAQLRGKTNLIIVPDDKLWDLPFQALLARNDRYVIERSAVSYVPSLTVLRDMKSQRNRRAPEPAGYGLLALGNPTFGKESIERAALALRDEKLDPLPEAEKEVKALGQLYGNAHSKVYIGSEAREDRFKAEAAQARVLHFATHGILNNASPMYSHLALAQGDTNEDGLLEAWELMRLDLKADLAVLSACETARGRVGAGEGMIGLSWAMFIAGVPAIVVSQWKVESASTRDLMINFHQALAAPAAAKLKATKAEALRRAALKLMKNPETSHPFYWAGFVLVGDNR